MKLYKLITQSSFAQMASLIASNHYTNRFELNMYILNVITILTVYLTLKAQIAIGQNILRKQKISYHKSNQDIKSLSNDESKEWPLIGSVHQVSKFCF